MNGGCARITSKIEIQGDTEGPSWQNEREIGAFMASEVAIEFGGRALKSLNDKVRELGA